MDTLADRLRAIHERVLDPSTGKPYSYRSMAHVLHERGSDVSAPYLSQLFTGARTQPSFTTVRALATFYGVSLAYFDLEDKETPPAVLQQLDTLLLARDHRFRQFMTRGTTPEDRQALIDTLLEAIEEADKENGAPPQSS